MNYGNLPKSVDPVIKEASTGKETSTGHERSSPGAYVLDELTLGKILDDGQSGPEFHQAVDLTSRFSTISIHQSLADSFMSMIIGISDATQMLERLGSKGLQGEEFVKIKLYSPGRDPVDLLFHVAGITPVISDDHQKTMFYNLVCTTKEKLINDVSNINKWFSATAAECAQSIWENGLLKHPKYTMLKTTKGIVWEDREFFNSASVGTEDFIVPGLQISSAMDWLSKKAYGGPDYPGSLYYFFENNLGFHFCNIETYIEINKGSGRKFSYTPQQIAKSPQALDQLGSIQTISGISMPSTSERINSGTYSHTVRTLDLIDKKHNDTFFNLNEKFDSFQNPGNVFNTSNKFFDEIAKDTFFEYLTTKDSTSNDSNIERITGTREAYRDLLNSYRVTIMVYGDTELNVGDVIEIELPETGSSGDRDLSIYSGSWLVQALTHVCDNEKLNTTLTLSKGGLNHEPTNT
jgi:hypothetical protein